MSSGSDAKKGVVVLCAIRLPDTTWQEIEDGIEALVTPRYKRSEGGKRKLNPSPRIFAAANGTPCIAVTFSDLVPHPDPDDGRVGAYLIQGWNYEMVRDCFGGDDMVRDIGVDAHDILMAAWDMPIKTFRDLARNPRALPGYAYAGDIPYAPKDEPEPPWEDEDDHSEDPNVIELKAVTIQDVVDALNRGTQ